MPVMTEPAHAGVVAPAVGPPRISYVVARLERAIRKAINQRVKPYGLTTLQYTTLSVLRRQGRPLSNAQLARRAYMTPQAMGEVIEALERKGLIERTAHPNHRRVFPAVLTPEGVRVLALCDEEVEAFEQEMLRDLDNGQRAALADGLRAAVRALGAGLPQPLQ
jgi:DNA-binding MarR family transcriptional regulator